MNTNLRRQLSKLLVAGFCIAAWSSVFAQEHKGKAIGDKASTKHMADPYYLAACPVSGEKLGGMGDPVSKVYDGREVRFCCGKCPAQFEKDLPANLAKLDQKMIEDQRGLYPMKTSVVSGKELPASPVEFIYGNRLIRVADAAEKETFMKEPKGYIEKLDKAVIAEQGKNYPLNTCVVSGEKFTAEMGEPKNAVVAGRLVKLCCNQCRGDLEKSPAVFVAKVDAARKGGAKEGKP